MSVYELALDSAHLVELLRQQERRERQAESADRQRWEQLEAEEQDYWNSLIQESIEEQEQAEADEVEEMFDWVARYQDGRFARG